MQKLRLKMLRYVHIGDQIEDDENQFAFFNTQTGLFVTIDGEQVWNNKEDLLRCWLGCPVNISKEFLARMMGLIPSYGIPKTS